jgi:hypothetical protein
VSGGRDRRPLLAAVVAGAQIWASPDVAAEAADLGLVLASDGSGSIDDAELRPQREGYTAAITHPRILI